MSKSFIHKKLRFFLVIITVVSIQHVGVEQTQAKVRPSDINHPTDQFGLGRGYAPPGAIFDLNLWGGGGGISDPYAARSQVGFFFNARSPFDSGELGISFGMFNHSYEGRTDKESGTYTTNFILDWRWRGGNRGVHDPYFGVGVTLPTRKMSGEGGFEGEAQLDAFQMALASRFGGQNRWIWEPNTASAFFETGGRATWGDFLLEGDLGAAYMYRVANSNVIENANLFIQASVGLGLQGDYAGLTVGGGYAITPLSLAEDVDQLHAKLTYTYVIKSKEYYASIIVPIDAPAGLLAEQIGATAMLGIQGQL